MKNAEKSLRRSEDAFIRNSRECETLGNCQNKTMEFVRRYLFRYPIIRINLFPEFRSAYGNETDCHGKYFPCNEIIFMHLYEIFVDEIFIHFEIRMRLVTELFFRVINVTGNDCFRNF